jgi:hypothetical protein
VTRFERNRIIAHHQAAVGDGLGLALAVEQDANAGFQDVESGAMLWLARLGYVYVLYHDGDWRRFSDRPEPYNTFTTPARSSFGTPTARSA